MGRGVGDIGSAKLLNGRNAVEGSCVGCGPTRKRTQGPGGGSQRGKLLRMVQDEGLAAKLSSLLLRLMSAFEHLRVRAITIVFTSMDVSAESAKGPPLSFLTGRHSCIVCG